mmetsp:Transcript_43549/g.81831  ORF Transcript_43549/g.81831 Transcript_43549/m.81831 type:complete len:616 (+) Transcript_43549:68-1915(+)
MAAPPLSALRLVPASARSAFARFQGRTLRGLCVPSSSAVVPTLSAWHGSSRGYSGQASYLASGSHWVSVLSIATVGGSLLALAEDRRRRTASCASLCRVCLGKTEEFEDGSTREIPLSAESKPEKGGPVVLVNRQGGVFSATLQESSHFSAALRQDITTSVVTCKVQVVDGAVYAEVPQDLAPGASKDVTQRSQQDERVFALIGSGPASLSAAETLRQEGFAGRIVMITKEAHLPYDRTLLSKNMEASVDELLIRTQDFFEKFGIEVVKEAMVTRLNSKGQEVHYKTPGGKQVLKYDKVLVATGGSPRKLFVPGATLKNIHTLRTPEDAAQISKYAKKGSRMIVVGGSFIGMEVACLLKSKGCDVHVIAMETVPFERVLGKKVGAAFARLLKKEGVHWHGSSQVRLFRGNDAVNGVELVDGEVLPTDGVVIGAGVLPNTRFVEGASLDKNGAIIVSPLLNAQAVPSLFAAGDVCAYPAMQTGTWVRIEHWEIATQQGRAAAKNMLGQYSPFTQTPFFWSSLFGKNLRFVGHAPDMLDRVIIEGKPTDMEFISYYTQDDRIWAVATVNRDSVAAACAELMRLNKMPKVSEIMLGVCNADGILQRLRDLGPAPATAA